MKRLLSTVLLFALLFAFPAGAQEPVDQAVIARIRQEACARARVMETIFYLADVHGSRLRGTPNYKAAAESFITAMREEKLPRKPLPMK